MSIQNTVCVDKSYIQKSLCTKESIATTLSRFIDNSIKAQHKISTGSNPCKVEMSIFDNIISIKDNSGGIEENITDKELFRIGSITGENGQGIGLKKSLFILGSKIDIISNRKMLSKKFSMDFKDKGNELKSRMILIQYNPNDDEGTTIYISNLKNRIKQQLGSKKYKQEIRTELGRMYSKFISSGELVIKLNNFPIRAIGISGEIISRGILLGKYKINLYKGKGEHPGIDIFVNKHMIYKRERSKEVLWNHLNEAKHSYCDCVVEVNCNSTFKAFEDEKQELFRCIIEFIRDNKSRFISNTTRVEFEVPVVKVEELENYYGESSAKAIGQKAFDKLYEDYAWRRKLKEVDKE